ncbi:MAG: hypothetical protein EA412_07750 [Chitinophagaceae bacterium]|nr:MAG: hypothetical protein EA412_07750 [Chitinophagaceae bacterium]
MKFPRALYIAGFIILAIIAAYAFIYFFITAQIKKEIHDELEKFWSENYNCPLEIEISKISVNPFFNKISIDDIQIRSDIKDCSENTMGFTFLPEFAIKNITIQLSRTAVLKVFGYEILPSELVVNEIDLLIYQNRDSESDEQLTEEKNDKSDFPLRYLEINNLNVQVLDVEDLKKVFEVTNLNFSADFSVSKEGVYLDDESVISLSGEDIFFQIGESDYLFNSKKIEILNRGKELKVTNLSFNPYYDKIEYSGRLEYQDDHLDFTFDSIILFGFDYNKFLKDGELYLESLFVHGMKGNVYRDKNVPFDYTRRPKMPAQLVSSIPFDIKLDSLFVKDAFIQYEEVAEGKAEPGVINFHNLNAVIDNLTNVFTDTADTNIMGIVASSDVFDEIFIKAKFKYDLSSSEGDFTVSGSAASFKFDVINPMLEPLSGIRITDGLVQKCFFNIYGDNFASKGDFELYYDDVTFDISAENMEGFIFFKRVLARLGNRLLIKGSNPDRRGNFKVGKIDFKRDQTKFIFNYWWKSLFTGIESTMVSLNPTLKEFFPQYDVGSKDLQQ